MESTDSSIGSKQPQLPPGFRFHPTDEELVVHYLKKKAASAPLPVAIIAEVDIYKFDPWELPAKAVYGEQEWYFFSPRDRKYPNGARPNRAATSGYWKATGTDKPVLTAGGTQKVGVKKALVFYGGKPPKGIKTSWIMHEYRLVDNKPALSKPPGGRKRSLRLDDWVLCRIYKKSNPQRPADQEKDDTNDIIGSIPQSISMPIGQLKFLENDQNLYEGMSPYTVNSHHSGLSSSRAAPQLPLGFSNLLPAKSSLPSLCRSNENSLSTKIFLAENGVGITDSATANSMDAILNRLPATSSLGQQTTLENLGGGEFEQQAYQVLGMNWYS